MFSGFVLFPLLADVAAKSKPGAGQASPGLVSHSLRWERLQHGHAALERDPDSRSGSRKELEDAFAEAG